MDELTEQYQAAKRLAKLLYDAGLTGWVDKGQVIRALSGDRKYAEQGLDTLLVYGFAKRRTRGGKYVYGISLKKEVQERNLEELILLYTNQRIILDGNIKKVQNIQRVAKGKKPRTWPGFRAWWRMKILKKSR